MRDAWWAAIKKGGSSAKDPPWYGVLIPAGVQYKADTPPYFPKKEAFPPGKPTDFAGFRLI
ncbi:hypothetical protein [Polaromonas sp.]|uniref:hypothetical protein n=1 Tax=Polaromonas sp. TaxID=1869339 RepID=UPI00326510B3